VSSAIALVCGFSLTAETRSANAVSRIMLKRDRVLSSLRVAMIAVGEIAKGISEVTS
jgi:hypothetical protein